MATLKPEDVFTPNAPVTEKEMFSERPLEIERINNALNEKGAQLLIYGPTGVGKTSLILYVLKLRGELHWTYRCDTVTTYQKIFSSIMAEWGPERVKSKKSTLGGKANLQTDFPFIVKGGVNGKIEKEKETIPWEEGVESITIINTIAPKGLILFFDDFEKIADITTKTVIANLSKHMSDIGAKYPKAKVVIVGIAESPANLIELDKSLTDRMHQIEINRMKDEEIAKIIEKGSKLL
jgi:Cdc6-like AAA superfamily ATPase